MKNCLVVLLLLCALSRAEPQERKTITKRSANNNEPPQPCPSDVHAVLRDMSAKLSVLQFQVDQLQTLNQEQGAKLLEQGNKLMEFQTREVDPIKEILRGQTAELNSIKARTNVTETHVDSLRRDRAVGQVAFSASLLASGEATLGPFNTLTTLEFKHVVSNIGNAYSPNTGLFTAPLRGAYHFEFYIYAALHGSHGSGAVLVKNGHRIFSSWERVSSGGSTSANGVTLLLEAGDVVYVRQFANTVIDDNKDNLSTFSGHLLFPMLDV